MNGIRKQSRLRNWILASFGLLSVALGIVGIFVPGLPTTVFLLIASWLFARSCPALQRRLHAHPQLGAYLRMARERRMPLRAKLLSIAAIWGGIGFALWTRASDSTPLAVALVTSAVAGSVAVVLLGVRRSFTVDALSSLRASRPAETARLTRVQAGF